MDYPRYKFSCIQWEFQGEEKVLFREQFANWDETVIEVEIPAIIVGEAAKGTQHSVNAIHVLIHFIISLKR